MGGKSEIWAVAPCGSGVGLPGCEPQHSRMPKSTGLRVDAEVWIDAYASLIGTTPY